jgi:predicted transcriptional regulator
MKLGGMAPVELQSCRSLFYRIAGIAMKAVNNIREIRHERMISKTELARLAGVSAATIDRIEKGESCRMETMRKILLALGLTLEDREKVFPD